jgi:hypothetical protein
MTDDQWPTTKLDSTKPNVARIWDVQLGGKDNFEADRHAAAEINKVCKEAGAPDGAAVAGETRAWLRSAIAFLTRRGIEQFIDLGVGLPARENVHEFAQRLNPRARTVYVDNDEMVMAHGRALLADNRSTIAIQGDLRDPDTIFRDDDLRGLLELDRPVAVLFVAVLDLLPDEEAIASVLARIRQAVPPGSYLAITHATSDGHPEAAAALVDAYARLGVNTPMVPRTAKEIQQFFDGWELVEPGLVSPAQWHPELADQHHPDTGWTYAGIGYLEPRRNPPQTRPPRPRPHGTPGTRPHPDGAADQRTGPARRRAAPPTRSPSAQPCTPSRRSVDASGGPIVMWSRRRRKARHQPPPQPAEIASPAPPSPPAPEPWQPVAAQFASRVLLLAWSAGSHLAEVEDAEHDPGQLQRLYRTDHALTRIRRWAENLQVLAGMRIEDPGRQITTLLDVIRAAASAVEHYDRVQIGRVAELAVAEVAADDVIRVLTELIDNAVKFSHPTTPVTVSAHLTDAGHVLVRVEDSGIGVDSAQLPQINAMLGGAAAPTLNDQQATRLGLLVVACLTRAHRSLRVQLSPRQPAGTVAMLLIGTELICEIPSAVVMPPASPRHVPQVMPPASPPVRLRAVRSAAPPPQQPGHPPAQPRPNADATVTAVLPVHTPGTPAPMPRRIPGSARNTSQPAPANPAARTHERTWHDDAADFDAGVNDARP